MPEQQEYKNPRTPIETIEYARMAMAKHSRTTDRLVGDLLGVVDQMQADAEKIIDFAQEGITKPNRTTHQIAGSFLSIRTLAQNIVAPQPIPEEQNGATSESAALA